MQANENSPPEKNLPNFRYEKVNQYTLRAM